MNLQDGYGRMRTARAAIREDLTTEELFVMMIVLRDITMDQLDTMEDAKTANGLYRKLKEYFERDDAENNIVPW